MSPILEVDALRKVYGEGEREVEAIAGVAFTVDEGEFVCIVGPSGCGKTTLLKCMSGLLAPTSGEVRLRNERIAGPPEQMALVFQDYSRSLFPWMSVRGNVEFPLKHKRVAKKERQELVEQALAAVDLSRFIDYYPWQLSGGMQQRVAIARALAYRPTVLLMDEPFASVDAQTRGELEDMTLRLRDEFGVTIIFVTHDVDESVYLGDRIIVLSASPARVSETVRVDLPRPRDQIGTKKLPEFTDLRTHVYSSIKGGEAAEEPGSRLTEAAIEEAQG